MERASHSPAETEDLGRALGAACRGGELLVLVGELGVGKTQLVRGLAAGLGCDTDLVRSPSYTLCHRYPGRKVLHHFDLYFTEDPEDLERNELALSLERGDVVAVEWGDRFERVLPPDRLVVELQHQSPSERRTVLRARGPGARAWLARALPEDG